LTIGILGLSLVACGSAHTVENPTGRPVTVEAAHPAADPDNAKSYYSKDGTVPQLFPSCEGILSICLGTPLERVTKLLGIENSRNESGSDVYRTWMIGNPGLTLTVSTDSVGAVKFLTASLAQGERRFRVGLPNHLVMGRSTMADVRRKLGKPLKRQSEAAETDVFYELTYYAGGEGTEIQSFVYATKYGGPSDPKGFNAALWARPVTEYTVCYVSSDTTC
jgi:hypothetical protein